MFELSNGFCLGGVSKVKINLVELSNVRVNGQSSYRMLTVYCFCDIVYQNVLQSNYCANLINTSLRNRLTFWLEFWSFG